MWNQYRLLLIFVIQLCIGIINSTAQQSLKRDGTEVAFTIFPTKDTSLTIHDILANDDKFINFESSSEKSHPSTIYWIKIDLTNELDILKSEDKWFLRTPSFEYATMFLQRNDSITELHYGRLFNQNKEGRSLLYRSGIEFDASSLIKNRYIYMKVKRVVAFNQIKSWKITYGSAFKNDLIKEFYSKGDLKKLVPIYIFTGICLVMFIFTLVFFLYTNRFEFLFYASFVLFLFLYLTGDVFRLHELFFGKFGLISYTFFQISQVIINLAYILFVMFYLNTKAIYGKLHIALKLIAYILAVVIILDVAFLLLKYFVGHIYLLHIERIIMTVFGLLGMTYLLIKGKDKLTIFIVTGSFFYLIGALGLLFFHQRLYMIIGSTLEILIFASGLTYKIQQEYIEKLSFQKESMLNKNKALRAQMNPHFIFNSLSSIQHLISSNKKEPAIKYLNKFSLLMRSILEGSIETNAVLSDEISLLKKYLELEALRFNDSFNYHFLINENVDPDAIEVPTLIIQPFAENAILHGLMSKPNLDKNLYIRFKMAGSYLICEVEDDGIGRQAAEKMKSHLKHSKKSRGIEVTEKRLQLLHHADKNVIEIIDKKDEKGSPSGTLVIIKIFIE